MLIGGIYLYRTYALYEEKKEFNVLKGRVPDFSNWSITYKVDGVTTTKPSKGSVVKTGITCSGVTGASWSDSNWEISYSTSNLTSKDVSCTVNFSRYLGNMVAIGDYISYTPSSTSYTISKSLTGNSADQTINPSELNLWRVIRINADKTVDAVSEYISDNIVYFNGQTGYKNLVATLQTIAAQYTNNTYTTKARHMGYDGQIETLTVAINATTSKNCYVGGHKITWSNDYESKGCGDLKYETDLNLVTNALGTLAARNPSGTANQNYHLCSRLATFTGSDIGVNLRNINNAGQLKNLGQIYHNNPEYQTGVGRKGARIRPIVTLKATLIASDLGNKTDAIQNKTFKHWKVN